jgi:HAMP domain-containing protein
MATLTLKVPTFGFIVATRAALAAGIGLLMAGRLTDEQRRRVGLTLVTLGAATTIPAAMAVFRNRVAS